MKTLLQTLLGMAILVAIGVAYLNLPIQWRRHKDIQLGNQIIAQIQQFQRSHQRLPENSEAELIPLGFKHNKQGWQPNYIRHSPSEYEIRYQDGYVAPYLRWQSSKQTWELVEENVSVLKTHFQAS